MITAEYVRERLQYNPVTEILSRSGLSKGVYKNGNGFGVRIRRNGKMIYLGIFNIPEEASAAYQEAEK
jgi:hypothetical protein